MKDGSGELTPLKRAVLALDRMKAELDALQSARREPIAIVGMGCRFPGGADDPQSFWRLLTDGVDGVREVPGDRWPVEDFYDPDPEAPGKMSTRWGGFLDGVGDFDADFFAVTPREAAAMDPQQRLLLEVAWQALEDGGQTLETAAGSRTGVFVGVCAGDYLSYQLARQTGVDAYTTTGNAHSIVANRLSHHLDLRGPSLVVDTACSSSLVAIHLACQSLRTGECDMALAGGVQLILMPIGAVSFSKWGMMAADGRCKAFDARADGFVRGEGCGVVVLKRLRQAVADGDPIWGLIRGSATNQDGRSTVLTAPSAPAQQEVVAAALRAGGVLPEALGYVEAHGTGTALGDPIEVEALAAVLGKPRPPGHDCVLGSVKTNLGHLEAAAGVAGLIKAVLASRHGVIPPTLHFRSLNPSISLEGTPFVIADRAMPWPESDGRFAGVSSFGFGGTNAHVVIEGVEAEDEGGAPAAGPWLLPLSARSRGSLLALAAAYRAAVSPQGACAGTPLVDLCFTAGVRRSHHGVRAAVVAASHRELADRLDGLRDGRLGEGVAIRAASDPGSGGKLAFVFSGQGGQWAGMGRELAEREPVFRQVLERCDEILERHVDWSVLEELCAEGSRSRLRSTEIAQSAVFAWQIALVALWRSWGVEPDAVVGHSVGELAAAQVAGILDLEDALRIALHRGRLMQRVAGQGRMAALALPVAEARQLLAGRERRLAIAAINSPRSTVVSGDPEAVAEVLESLRGRDVFARLLDVDYAFHSPQMAPFAGELEAELRALAPRTASLPMVSTLSGGPVSGPEMDAAYWGRHLVEPVRFGPAVGELTREGYDLFLEIGGHPTLLRPLAECAAEPERRVTALASSRRAAPVKQTLLAAAGELYVAGRPIEWRRVNGEGRCVRLPAYPFDRRRYWIDGGPGEGLAAALRPRAAERTDDWLYELSWQPRSASAPRSGDRSPGYWLILADRGGTGDALARALLERGEHCAVAHPGELRRLVAESAGSAVPWRGVVHLWSLDASTGEDLCAESLEAAQRQGCGSALDLVRALIEGSGDSTPRIWWVTRGAQPVLEGASPAVAQAPLWGFARVAALEHPELWGGLVDLDPETTAGDVSALLTAIGSAEDPDGEDQVAWRAGRQYVARLIRGGAKEPPPPFEARHDGTYLVTGGLGGLGLRVADWLVERGARHLVLLGRRGMPEHVARPVVAAIRALEDRGAEVRVVAADVGEADALARALAPFLEGAVPLRGIVHAAGLSRPRPLLDLDAETLREVLRAKVSGTWNLHRLTHELSLDFFVCFSSVAGVWGSVELAHYAAANHFLDAMAHYRRALGLRATSVAWGPWESAGMISDADRETLERMGVHALAPERALAVLAGLLTGRDACKVVASMDWSRFEPLFNARRPRPLLRRLEPRPAEEGRPVAGRAELREQLRAAAAGERRDLLITHLEREVAGVLEIDPARLAGTSRGFFDLGMDSLLALALQRRLEASLGTRLSATLAFDYPSLGTLADHLLTEVLDLGPPAAAPSGPGRDEERLRAALASLDELSEAEAEALLAAETSRKRNPL